MGEPLLSSLIGRSAGGRIYVNEGSERTPVAGSRAVAGTIVALAYSGETFVALIEVHDSSRGEVAKLTRWHLTDRPGAAR